MKGRILALWLLVLSEIFEYRSAFRILKSGQSVPDASYFKPYDKGFTGTYGDATLYQRERINEGAFDSADEELLYEGVSPRQSCPGMVGPFSDGNYYCTAKEYGYCDKRSGTCFCNAGYRGIDCSECQDSHFLLGSLCYPKTLCPNNCNGAGTCNDNNGTCNCFPHRTGKQCETLLCSIHDKYCETCTESTCLRCAAGYYLTGTVGEVCGSCYDFDPRCAGCTSESGCTVCADSTLTSILRSGYRNSDRQLPPEENLREFSITLPFGTKSPESFAEAENYFVCTTPDHPLNKKSISCDQGLHDDETWNCKTYPESHQVCGHYGVFTFKYPNYRVSETDKEIRMNVSRSGGGYGNVTISYFIKHFTTNDSDLVATAQYTTSQTLSFDEGVIERTFKISILDDNIVEENEVFQVVLEVPEGGGSVGAQFRANITIVDNDLPLISAKLTKLLQNTTSAVAGMPFKVYVKAVAANGKTMNTGGELFFAVIENDESQWMDPGTPSNSQRNYLRKTCNVNDVFGNGTYEVSCGGIATQGQYQLRVWHAFPSSLRGDYFYDAFFNNLAVYRLDQKVNFTWGTGRLIPRGRDYISIRWSGAILTEGAGLYQFKVDANDQARLWVDGDLLIDHWHEDAVYLEPSRSVQLQSSTLYEIVLEYREVTGSAHARLMWSTPGTTSGIHVVPQKNLYTLFEVDRSPVKVTIFSDMAVAATTQCTGDGLFGAMALHTSYFSFCPRDQYRNMRDDHPVSVLTSAQIFTTVLILVDDMGYKGSGPEKLYPDTKFNPVTSCFDASYTPNRAGRYRLDIDYSRWYGFSQESVAGAPFYLTVLPDKTSGPISLVTGLSPLQGGGLLRAKAGKCYSFNVTARDKAFNYRKQGGDNIKTYAFRVNQYDRSSGYLPFTPTASPTSPSDLPPLDSSDYFGFPSFSGAAYVSDNAYGIDVVRKGTVVDLNNGEYLLQICPVISGLYEIHVLLGATGIANQHFTIQKTVSSLQATQASVTGSGEYIANSPYAMIVSHTKASAYTSTATGEGLSFALAGLPARFTVTVRDPWDNIVRDGQSLVTVTAKMDRLPSTAFDVTSIGNGTFHIVYSPTLSGGNLISVYVNGFQIRASPFTVTVFSSFAQFEAAVSSNISSPTPGSRRLESSSQAGFASAKYSYVSENGLFFGTTGVTSYFQLYVYDKFNNRVITNTDTFIFTVDGDPSLQSLSIPIVPCPLPPELNHPICDPFDAVGGHYFGQFVPLVSGYLVVRVFINDKNTNTLNELFISNFKPLISPSAPKAELSDVSGDIYDNIAGVTRFVNIQLRDYNNNKLIYGGDRLELALIGVGETFGTVEPFYPYEGLPNQFYYTGFYAGSPSVYGAVLDNQNGSYTIAYSSQTAGLYVMRLALAERGLNLTLFNDTTFGHLFDMNYNPINFDTKNLGQANNLDTTISWTGDIGGVSGARGDLGSGSYFGKYFSSKVESIEFDCTGKTTDSVFNTAASKLYKFRDEFWSARVTGMITPLYAEVYTFSVVIDGDSSLTLRIGGRGNEFNQSQPGDLVIRYNTSTILRSGEYSFSDTSSREFALEYAHFTGDAKLTLYWMSPSTPFSVIPSSAFTHWRNISLYNTTIHPAKLCSSCSTAVGDALSHAVVAVKKSFVVYGRDSFGNLLQQGGDAPTMFAVGTHGIAFRGVVTDYGNSTYLIEYYATRSGQFNIYVTIGCCPPDPAVGYPASISQAKALMIQGAPFQLTVEPAKVDQSRTVATGDGLVGGMVGEVHTYVIYFRDLYDNPTSIVPSQHIEVMVTFWDQDSADQIAPSLLTVSILPNNATIVYNITRAAHYWMNVSITFLETSSIVSNNNLKNVSASVVKPIIGSPFSLFMSPTVAVNPDHTVCLGVGLRQASVGQGASFQVNLFDNYHNALLVGGNKFYVRLIGDSSFANPATMAEAAPCSDLNGGGSYLCRYTPAYPGHHQLVVRLLLLDAANSNQRGPGGSGLLGSYYTSIDGSLSGTNSLANIVRVESKVSFQWPSGFIVPSSPTANTIQTLPLEGSGQSARWEGYLLSPRTDAFNLSAVSIGLNVTIYCDDQLVFDSFRGISTLVDMVADASYALLVIASAVPSASAAGPVTRSVNLQWSTQIIRPYTIPTFFLYPYAADVAFSPFSVAVH